MLENILARLDLSPGEIRTFLFLIENGPHSAGAIARKNGIVRATQYVFLKRLIEKGFVTQGQRGGTQLFSSVSPERVIQLYKERITALEDDLSSFKKIAPTLIKEAGRAITPTFELFEGAEGVKHVLKDMLLYKNIETHAYWPIKKMVDVLSPAFFRAHNKERIARGIHVRAIWPEKEIVSHKQHPYLGNGKAFLREIRIAPKEIDFKMGYWIYGNKVAFLSSQKESFGYIIESAELVEMLLSQFNVIWKQSKTL